MEGNKDWTVKKKKERLKIKNKTKQNKTKKKKKKKQPTKKTNLCDRSQHSILFQEIEGLDILHRSRFFLFCFVFKIKNGLCLCFSNLAALTENTVPPRTETTSLCVAVIQG
jgi:hypothetical protein